MLSKLVHQLFPTPLKLPPSFDISIDTRTLKPGDLFFAIQSETGDGHLYIDEALKKGACAAVIHSHFQTTQKAIIVENTLKALQLLAHTYLMKMPAKRIALTGSNGKTTTKEMLQAALVGCVGPEAVYASKGNLNNHLGVPLSALQVTPAHKYAIFEMGMNHFGEISTLAAIVKPHIGLITNMGTAHSGNLGGPEGVAKAKAELFEALGKQDIAIINADDPRCVREASEKANCIHATFGKAKWANVHLIESTLHPEEACTKVVFSILNSSYTLRLPLLGHHNAQNSSAALAVIFALKLDIHKAILGLENMKPVKGRLCIKNLSDGTVLIDDTYNANPESMEAGLNVLAQYTKARKVAILGPMAELGEYAPALHKTIGAACAQRGVELLLVCGDYAQAYGEGAIQAGLNAEQFFWAKDSHALSLQLTNRIRPHDVILVKGSRAAQMEHVVEALLEH